MGGDSGLRRTSLHAVHLRLGARMVPFAGYDMPIQYSGVIEEHAAVREAAGIFDLSHMGEIELRGDGVREFLDVLLTNRFADLQEGQARYSVMCAEDGGIIDDLIVYALAGRYLLVVNASNFEKDLEWIRRHAPSGVAVKDANDEFSLVAVQGPVAEELLSRVTSVDLSKLPYYGVVEGAVGNIPVILARTGYTGEDGFELYVAPSRACDLWETLEGAGTDVGLTPVGLGARDTLRLEMKYALYGNDIDDTTRPLEAGLGWVVKLDKGDFIGRDALVRLKEEGVARRLVAFEVEGRGVPRQGYDLCADGDPVGTVCSGTFSPTLRKGIGTAYVRKGHTRSGTRLVMDVRGRPVPVCVVKPPFYRDGSLRKAVG